MDFICNINGLLLLDTRVLFREKKMPLFGKIHESMRQQKMVAIWRQGEDSLCKTEDPERRKGRERKKELADGMRQRSTFDETTSRNSTI